MARGGKRVQRARRAASRGLAGAPSTAQGNRTSFAQSGGRATTFQGTAGGNSTWNSGEGGSRGTRARGRTTLSNGTSATLRSPGGDSTLIQGGHKGAGRLNLPKGATFKGNRGKTNTSIVKPHALPPKGFGGGY